MKALGIIRPIDELGRIVLPIETRRMLDLNPKDGVEVFVEEDKVILKKYRPSCVFCAEADGVRDYKGKKVCESCLSELKALAD